VIGKAPLLAGNCADASWRDKQIPPEVTMNDRKLTVLTRIAGLLALGKSAAR
jgi:hypothetical protein